MEMFITYIVTMIVKLIMATVKFFAKQKFVTRKQHQADIAALRSEQAITIAIVTLVVVAGVVLINRRK